MKKKSKLVNLANRISETDIMADIVASALLSECRKESHTTLYSRFKGNASKTHFKMMKCIHKFMRKNRIDQTWISLRTPKQEVYYLNMKSGKTQWERPKFLHEIIEKGKRESHSYPKEEKWKECEFLHVQLVQCEQKSHLLKLGANYCSMEMRKLSRCFRKRELDFDDKDF